MNFTKWKAIGILLAVFSLGAVTGGAAMAAWNGKQRLEVARLGFGAHGARPVMALMRRLDLSEQQRDAIESVLEKHAPARRAIMHEMMGKCGQELEKEKALLDGEIRAVLTPSQRERFDELSARQQERLLGPERPRGPHRPHGPRGE